MSKHFQVKTCLHPAAGGKPCGSPIIRAHTLSRRGPIARLCGDDQRVLSFYPFRWDPRGSLTVHRVGWRKASTFYGFCSAHDDAVFSEVEKKLFEGTARQAALVGYRAVCHELYQKTAARNADPFLRRNVDAGLPEAAQLEVQSHLTGARAGYEDAISEIAVEKQIYDAAISSGDLSGLSTTSVLFRGDLSVASTGLVHVDFDIAGSRLQNVFDPTVPLQGLAFGVVAIPSGGAFVMSWLRRSTKVRAFVDSLLAASGERLPGLLIEFMFGYVENSYFSEQWWRSLTVKQQARIRALTGTLAYVNPIAYSDEKWVDWKVERVLRDPPLRNGPYR